MTIRKKALIIEDEKQFQLLLQEGLEGYGFGTDVAGDVKTARDLAERHWPEYDVLVLDMDLKDPNRVTGADIAIEYRRKMESFPPESLIYSWSKDVDYYHLAMKLGAAAYLYKERHQVAVVVQHARALALRRALSGENPTVLKELGRIAVHSESKAKAMELFCRRVLKPEFESCLGEGARFIVLFTEGGKTWNYADNLDIDMPEADGDFYHTLQAYAHGKYEMTEPVILDTNELGAPESRECRPFYEQLNRAALLPLSLSDNCRLSIGLLHRERPGEHGEPTEEAILCRALAEYLRPTVIKNVLNVWSQWTELRATRMSTATLCLAVGYEVWEGLAASDREQLEDLSNDLKDTGEYLSEIESRSGLDKVAGVPFGEAFAAAWASVAPPEGEGALRHELHGDCVVQAQREDLMIIISRLLQWFVYRSKVMPLDLEPVVKVVCEPGEGAVSVTFEDNSERLPGKLREVMFAPFSQAIPTPFGKLAGGRRAKGAGTGKEGGRRANPGRYLPLYLAKMLVEGRYYGILEDRTGELKGRSYGHRILMQFPTKGAAN